MFGWGRKTRKGEIPVPIREVWRRKNLNSGPFFATVSARLGEKGRRRRRRKEEKKKRGHCGGTTFKGERHISLSFDFAREKKEEKRRRKAGEGIGEVRKVAAKTDRTQERRAQEKKTRSSKGWGRTWARPERRGVLGRAGAKKAQRTLQGTRKKDRRKAWLFCRERGEGKR